MTEERVLFKWNKLKNLKETRASHIIFTYNKKIYIFLGEEVDCQYAEQVSSSLNEYSFISKVSTIKNIPLLKMFPTYFQKKNLIYIFGGFSKLTDFSDQFCEMFLFDLETSELKSLITKNPPSYRRYHCSAELSDKFYVFGGEDDINRTSLNDLHCLDVKTLSWSLMISHNGKYPRRRRYASLVSVNNQLYLFGGRDEVERMNDMWEYDISLEHWTLLETYGEIPRPITCPTPVVQGHSIFYFGGNLNGESTNLLYEFHIPTSKWTLIQTFGDIPTCRYWNASVSSEFHEMIVHGGYDTFLKCNISDGYRILLPKRNKNLKMDVNLLRKKNIHLNLSFKFE
jgi:N-acetylneuraminic acid mutarotase